MSSSAGDVVSRNMSMGDYLKRRYEQTTRALTCQARSTQEWHTWRERFKCKLMELMAPWPEPCPLHAITLDRVQRDGFVQERVLFNSEPDMAVPAYVLIPDTYDGSTRYPALVCQHGHGNGKDDVVGMAHATHAQWLSVQETRYDYAAALARQGYVAIAMDARGFGERALGYMFGGGENGCNMVQLKAQLLGLNLLTLNVFDLLRCIDYLTARPEVDPQRIGCVGLSYGGTLTLFSAALDERIKVAVVSGYLSSLYEQTFVRGDTCGSQIVPNLARWGELSDVACLVAPRAFLIESGTEDNMFGIDAARAAFQELRRLYAVLNVAEKTAHHVFVGGHRWDGARTAAWLERWL
jgi:dienelactone hydrolase